MNDDTFYTDDQLEASLGHLSDDDLKQEMERRKRKAEAEVAPKLRGLVAMLPDPFKSDPLFQKLTEVCKDYMEFIESDDFHTDNDYDRFIQSAAMIAFYGVGFWDWHNKKVR